MKLFLVFLFVASCQARTFSKVSKCPPGYYGSYCRERCSACPEDSCDPVSGQCLLLCPPGKIGDRCDTGCTLGYYGKYCFKRCDDCPEQQCDPVFGHCELPCPPEKTGDRCDIDYKKAKEVELEKLVKVAKDVISEALETEYHNKDKHERREPNLKIALFTTPNGRYVIKIGSKMNLKMTHNIETNVMNANTNMLNGQDSVLESFQKVLDNLMRGVKEMEKQGGLEVVLGDIFENIPEEVASKVEDDAFERRDWGKNRPEKSQPVIKIKTLAKDVEDGARVRRYFCANNGVGINLGHVSGKLNDYWWLC